MLPQDGGGGDNTNLVHHKFVARGHKSFGEEVNMLMTRWNM